MGLVRHVRVLLFLSCLVVVVIQPTHAFPTGAGACPEGEPAVGGPHIRGSANITMGSLRDGDVWMQIGDEKLSVANEAITLPINTPTDWVLYSDGAPFRGFLIRLGGGSQDLDTTSDGGSYLDSPSIPNEAQVAIPCFDVGGITHTNNGEKIGITGTINIAEASRDMTLDITVVMRNSNRVSIFFHSTLYINAEEAATTPTPSSAVTSDVGPTSEPTDMYTYYPPPQPTSQETYTPSQQNTYGPTPVATDPPPTSYIGTYGPTQIDTPQPSYREDTYGPTQIVTDPPPSHQPWPEPTQLDTPQPSYQETYGPTQIVTDPPPTGYIGTYGPTQIDTPQPSYQETYDPTQIVTDPPPTSYIGTYGPTQIDTPQPSLQDTYGPTHMDYTLPPSRHQGGTYGPTPVAAYPPPTSNPEETYAPSQLFYTPQPTDQGTYVPSQGYTAYPTHYYTETYGPDTPQPTQQETYGPTQGYTYTTTETYSPSSYGYTNGPTSYDTQTYVPTSEETFVPSASEILLWGRTYNIATTETIIRNNDGLEGTIPPEVGYLRELRELHLSKNALTGSIPTTLEWLTKLQSLRLNSNSLTGTIPPELGQLTLLRFLWLDDNLLTGTVPPSICEIEQVNWDVDCDRVDCTTCYAATVSPTDPGVSDQVCDYDWVNGDIQGDRCYAVDTDLCVTTTYGTQQCELYELNFTYYNGRYDDAWKGKQARKKAKKQQQQKTQGSAGADASSSGSDASTPVVGVISVGTDADADDTGSNDRGIFDSVFCPNFPSNGTCVTCLDAGCSWIFGNCYSFCAIADAPCYNLDRFNGTATEVCTAYTVDRENDKICGDQQDCASCVATALTPGGSSNDGTCHWFPNGNYCLKNACGMLGCGTKTCSSASNNTTKSSNSNDNSRGSFGTGNGGSSEDNNNSNSTDSQDDGSVSSDGNGGNPTDSNSTSKDSADDNGTGGQSADSSNDRVNVDSIFCANFPSNGTCETCLDAGCSWIFGECYKSCEFVTDAPCYNFEWFNGTAMEICAAYTVDRENDRICGEHHQDCASCVATALTPGGSSDDGTCHWFPNGNYCLKDACGMLGCGTNTCSSANGNSTDSQDDGSVSSDGNGGNSADSNSTSKDSADDNGAGGQSADDSNDRGIFHSMVCPNFPSDGTCETCLDAGCSWLSGECYKSCEFVADAFCYDFDRFNGTATEICAAYAVDRENDRICGGHHQDCSSCVATALTPGGSRNDGTCHWFPSRSACRKDACGLFGCGTNTCPSVDNNSNSTDSQDDVSVSSDGNGGNSTDSNNTSTDSADELGPRSGPKPSGNGNSNSGMRLLEDSDEYEVYAEVSVTLDTCSQTCEISIGGYVCNTCEVPRGKNNRVTMVDCSNVPADVLEGTFETPQTIRLDEDAVFELTSTDDMCNHPAVAGASAAPTPAPTEIFYPMYCGDIWNFGEIPDGECSSYDSGFCIAEADKCMEASQGWWYYNQVYDQGEPVGAYDQYAYVYAFVDTCSGTCVIDVEGYSCDCTFNGTTVADTYLTMEDCSNVPSTAIEGFFETPQAIKMGGAPFKLTPTDAMCTHPAVLTTTDSKSNRGGGGNGKPATGGGALVRKLPITLTFFFDAGTGSDLNLMDRTQLFSATMKFMQMSLRNNAKFKDDLQDATMTQIEVNYNAAESPDEWAFSFVALISLEPGTKASHRQCLEGLAAGNWDQYIHEYVHPHEENPLRRSKTADVSKLDDIRRVKFRAVGSGG